MGQMDALFQKSYVDPAMKAFNQQIVPGLQEQLGESSASGALNRALSGAAGDIATGLGQQYGNFYQQQQQQGAQGLAGLSQQRTFEPTFNQQQGILGPLIGAIGDMVAAYASGGATLPASIARNASQGSSAVAGSRPIN